MITIQKTRRPPWIICALMVAALGFEGRVIAQERPSVSNSSPTSKRMRESLNSHRSPGQFFYSLRQTSPGSRPSSHRLVAELRKQEENRARKPADMPANDRFDILPLSDSSDSDSSDSTVQFVDPPATEMATRQTFNAATLEMFEQTALQNHPTLNAAVAKVRTAQQEGLQAGLGPNPQLGLFVDEFGNENDPGIWGAYIQRNIVRGNKLGLAREIKNREATVLELEFEKQVLRIKTDVRTAFYRLLIAQQKYELAFQLYESQKNAITKSEQLFEAGETPKTDLLQTELQARKTLVLLRQSEVSIQNLWRELAVAIGQPALAYQVISGELDPITQSVSYEFCLSQIMSKSPELLQANAEVEKARASVNREVAETVSNYQTQLTLGRDSTSNHFFTGLQVQVPIQVCNRNQGNIAAANSRVVEAQHNLETIKLKLAQRLAVEYRQYDAALQKSNLFVSELLPKSQETLQLLTQGYPEEVNILQVLSAQQQVIDITTEFLDSINQVWTSRVRIEGLLLDDSLNQ